MKRDLGLEIPRDRMLTVREVAKILRMTEQRVRIRAQQRGFIRRTKFGTRVLFAPADVEAYINKHRGAGA